MINTIGRVLLCALLATFIAGCGGGGGGGSGDAGNGGTTNTTNNGGGGSTPPPPPAPTCTSDVAQAANSAPNAAAVKTLLTNTTWSNGLTCLNCHGGNAGLTLTTDNDWANNLINVNSTEQPALKRVSPGDAANSYLVRKLEGGPNITGNRMPNGAAPMSTDQINQVKAWVNGIALCP